MTIRLSQTLGRSSPADPHDVQQIKKALNRLGYYMPHKEIGISGVTDDALFEAIKNFQRDQGLTVTGTLKPEDDTLVVLNKSVVAKQTGAYIWRIVEDGKTRPAHARLNGTIRSFADAPDPGDDFNCRCWAEPVAPITSDSVDHIYDPPIEPVYPEFIVLPFLRAGRFLKIAKSLLDTKQTKEKWNLNPAREQLQSKFKHAEEFGIK